MSRMERVFTRFEFAVSTDWQWMGLPITSYSAANNLLCLWPDRVTFRTGGKFPGELQTAG